MNEIYIRSCTNADFESILWTINDGAQAYRGYIPADCFHEPYMSGEQLQAEINDGVEFCACEQEGTLLAVMGLQHVRDVSLIRHAYVRREHQREGLGSRLLSHLRSQTSAPMLVGTWADASWAIAFYARHGFNVVANDVKMRLLRAYWNVPQRQIDVSVVLADQAGRNSTA